jgi:SnoaL-like protein
MGVADRRQPDAIGRWHDIVRSRDHSLLDALLAEDVVFLSPVVHTPQRGKAITSKYLTAALAVLGGSDFRYVGQWTGPDSAVLEFVTTIDGIEVNGVDIIGWNGEGRIDRFKVMVRPLKAIEAVRQRMAAALAG